MPADVLKDRPDLPERVRRMLATDCGMSLNELAKKVKAEDLKALAALLSAPEETPEHLQRAVYLLGRLGKADVVEPIIAVLPRLNEGGRVAAADALGRLGGAKARDQVIKLSSDRAPQVRKFAAHALGRIGDKASTDRLKAMVEGDGQAFVRETARKRLEARK